MKKIILITLLISFSVEGDYLKHPKSEALIDELVTNHGFEQSFVEDVLSNAVRQQKIIDSISKPAEFTWTCLLYTSPSPRDRQKSRMPSSA